jgi:hypothetical protein
MQKKALGFGRFVFSFAVLLLCFSEWDREVQGGGLYKGLERAVAETEASGHLRLYNYSRINDSGTNIDDNALAAGGDLMIKTGTLEGFSLGFGFYTANNIPTGITINELLIGRDHYLYALAQAYLQYEREYILVRGGRQLIKTPWASPDMFTMLPRAFNGISLSIEPLPFLKLDKGESEYLEAKQGIHQVNPAGTEHPQPHFSFFAAHMFRYESRFDDHFTEGNRYTDEPTDGFSTIGFNYSQALEENHHFQAQGWYYNFYDFAELGYMEARYKWRTTSTFSPVVAAQIVAEGNSGDRRLGSVDARIYGALAGFTFPAGHVTLVGNWSPERFDSFRHGGLVHPYNDLSGTLFTDTMNNGVSDIGPCYAYGVKAAYELFDGQLGFSLAYVRYHVKYGFGGAAYSTDGPFGFPNGQPVRDQEQWALDAGVVYRFTGSLKGLTIEDHLGIRDFEDSPYGAFIDNRFACIYSFSF